jgi:hypothetical protein
MGFLVHQKILHKGVGFAELTQKIVAFFGFSRFLRSINEYFWSSCPQSFDVLHQILHLHAPHVLYRLPKNYAVTLICHEVSSRKVLLQTLCKGFAESSQTTFLSLLSAIFDIFLPNFGVLARSCPLPFDKR